MQSNFNIAVRSLVEYVLRSGDLRSDYFGSVRAVEGIRAHQQVQKQRPDNYQAEVPITYSTQVEDVHLCVSGRIDGLFVYPDRVVVEEIKTSQRSKKELASQSDPIHWGQAQCYAYMWAHQEGLDRIDVQLTYVNPHTGDTHEMLREFETASLHVFFEDLLQRYLQWLICIARWQESRDASLAQLDFPFETYRTGQRAMAVEVFRAVRGGEHLLVQAATGIGKTMAALFPAVKALGEKLAPKIIFLTARTTGRLAAETALDKLRANSARIKSVTLTAKEKICFNSGVACNPEECTYAAGFYDRINKAVASAFETDALTRTVIEATAREYQVCPFELSLELVTWADCIIGDYNYAFDPTVTLKRLFLENGGPHVVLVDEAHNLVDRSREMFSARLDKKPILALRRSLKAALPGLYRRLGRINTWMAAQRRQCRQKHDGGFIEKTVPHDLIDRISAFTYAAERWLSQNIRTPFRDELVTVFFDCLRFTRVAEQYDQHYSTIYQGEGEEFFIKLFCLDPSHQLEEAWARSGSAVLFSATLTPADYFQSILGCRETSKRLNLSSPFPQDNLGVFLAPRISTFYHQRKNSCKAVSDAMADLVCAHKGNYLFFFPSYEYLQLVNGQFSRDHGDIETVVQTPAMEESQRQSFIDRFGAQVRTTLVGFAVMGGIFGEGIDLKGDRLTGAAIVGVGLPGICLERELIRDYYNTLNGMGFEFAYQFPGINRVLQAAGRVIRSEKDQGVVLLIDQRYSQSRYLSLLPAHWRWSRIESGQLLQEALADFWSGRLQE